MAKHNDIGKQGEEAALNYLQKKGYEIIETNWRFKHLEVDIIAKHKEYIVFIEVKARSINFFSEPEKAVTIKKQKNLIKAANEYVISNNIDNEVRFDIIAVVIDKEITTINHIEEAFYPLL